jgi:hypothetical protein
VTTTIAAYLILGFVNGHVSARLFKFLAPRQGNWRRNVITTTFFSPR